MLGCRAQTNLPVTELVSLQGEKAGLELYILIDEKVNPNPAARFNEIRRFVASGGDHHRVYAQWRGYDCPDSD